MPAFGKMLRVYRRQSRDPMRGGLLTQARLGELIGDELGDAGYTGAAVSDWEREKSRISAADRAVLMAIVTVLHRCNGLQTLSEADDLLVAGDYRALNEAEAQRLFGRPAARSPSLEAPPSRPAGAPQPPPTAEPAAPQAAESRKQRDRRQSILLSKVRRFWVEGVLELSLAGKETLEIGMQRQDDLVDHPWEQVLATAVYDAGIEPMHTGILESYLEADRALLILGEPGSGKTTTLLTLARELVERAEADAATPVPVVLDLGSWAGTRPAMTDWIVEELVTKYQIPARIGRDWLDDDCLVLLLDSYDEIPAAHRPDLATAINLLRQTHGLTGIVVCSRLEEYRETGAYLRLYGSVILQPLTPEQVDRYIADSGLELRSLQQAVDQDRSLATFMRSPLMLSVTSVVFAGSQESDMPPLAEAAGDESALHHGLFAAYTDAVFQRRRLDPRFPEAQTRSWLAWLACRMQEHSQPLFLLERIQPDWLPERRLRWLYLLLSRLVDGISAGLTIFLFLLLVTWTFPERSEILSLRTAERISFMPASAASLALLMSLNLLLSLVIALVQMRLFESRENPANVNERVQWPEAAVYGLAAGVGAFLFFILLEAPALAWSLAIVEGVVFALVARFTFGRNYDTEIRIVETLGWSWRRALRGLVIGLIVTLLAEIVELILFPYNGFWRSLVLYCAGGMVLEGVTGRRVSQHAWPNQGIYLSLRNAVLGAGLAALVLFAVSWLIHGLRPALLTAGLVWFMTFPIFGGAIFVRHMFIRFLAWRSDWMPFNYVAFLDHAAALVLLQRVGGGYRFRHRLLQDYFRGPSHPDQ